MASDKAMQITHEAFFGNHDSFNDQQLWLAKAIDTHTSEALADYKRVLDEAEKALEVGEGICQHYIVQQPYNCREVAIGVHHKLCDALSAIAALKQTKAE